MRLFATCVVLGLLSRSAFAGPDPDDVPLDGALDASGAITDVNNGHLNEPAGIVASVAGCLDTVPNGYTKMIALDYCGCVADWLRTTTPRIVRAFMAAAQSGDLSKIDLRPIRACGAWASSERTSQEPHLRAKMMSSLQVMESYLACKKTTNGRRPNPDGMQYCNRVVGSTDQSLRTH
jgi:hypothetical protein